MKQLHRPVPNRLLLAITLAGLGNSLLPAQDSGPRFEAATIKPSEPAEEVSLRVSGSGLLTTTGTSLSDLIKFAYDLHQRQIIGGPAWMEEDKYDVTAKPEKPGAPNVSQVKARVRRLLAERFGLTFHRDKKELPVYTITVTKSGVKLTRNDSDPTGLYSFAIGNGRLNFTNATVTEFAAVLQANILDRPVSDQTGLGSVKYDLMLKWTPDGTQSRRGGPQIDLPPSTNNAGDPPDLFTAFQQQLGLKLESAKAPVDVLVIDSAERPDQN